MGNCLITQLKGSVNNSNLQPYGTVKVGCVETSSPSSDAQTLGIFAPNQTITVNGDGYFALTYEGLDDPSSRLTTYTIPLSQSSIMYLYFKNDNYNIFITGRYDTDWSFRYLNITKETSLQTIFSLDVDEFKYIYDFETLKASNQAKVYGHLSSLAKPHIKEISINGSTCVGSLMDLASCTSLATLLLNRLTQKDDIINFVAAQIVNGRETCTGISVYKPGTFSVFGGNAMNELSGFSTLSWTSSSHIVVEGSGYVYAKGASAEEIAEWEAEEKVVVVIG